MSYGACRHVADLGQLSLLGGVVLQSHAGGVFQCHLCFLPLSRLGEVFDFEIIGKHFLHSSPMLVNVREAISFTVY